ncbi:MAG: phage holin family protein [Patescibacteria group bacterium]
MTLLVNLLLSAIAVAIASYLIPGATVDTYLTAFIVAVVLAIVNTTIVPVLQVLTLPLNIVTLGLASLIINVLMVLLVARLVPGFEISGFWVALIFAVVLALVNMVL